MASEMDPHCMVFVDADITPMQLAKEIAQIVGGVEERFNRAHNEVIDIKVSKNKTRYAFGEPSRIAPFLDYRHCVWIDPIKEGVDLSRVIENVSHLLLALWACGYAAVAACDYEDSLPRRGGFNQDTPRATSS